MKKCKKYIRAVAILSAMGMLSVGTGNFVYAEEAAELTYAFQEYYEARLSAFNDNYERDFDVFIISDLVKGQNKAREEGLKEYEASIGADFIDVQCEVVIDQIEAAEYGYDVYLHENVNVYYQYGQNGSVDFFSFGTEHCVQLEKVFLQYRISKDYYDECMISNVDTYERSVYQNAESEMQEEWSVQADSINKKYVGYNANKSIAYANQYARSINNTYGEMTDANGNCMDCANFVSQCLEAGGVAYTGSNYSSDWYFIKAQKQGSQAWVNVEKFDAFWRNYGLTRAKATKLSLLPGNPFYWLPDASSGHGHLMICVGYDSAGTPIFDAHNPNRYQTPYIEASGHILYTMQFVVNCTSHKYPSFYGINTLYHYKTCSVCGHAMYTKHTFVNGKCTVCGVSQT